MKNHYISTEAYYSSFSGTVSPRVNGKLVLRPNPMTMSRAWPVVINKPSSINWSTTVTPITDIVWAENRAREMPYASLAYNIANERFFSNVWDDTRGLFAVDVVERAKTAEMILNQVSIIATAYRALRKGKLGAVGKILGMNSKDARRAAKLAARHGPKKLSNQWLEYQYGWVPLYHSVYTGVQIMATEPPDRFFRAKGSYDKFVPNAVSSGDWRGWRFVDINYRCRVTIAARVKVKDHNLYRLNQLGLVNPLQVAWDLVPFSFVADWFLPVSTYLAGFNQQAGLDITDSSVTTLPQPTSTQESYWA